MNASKFCDQSYPSLVAMLEHYAKEDSERLVLNYLEDGERPGRVLSCQDLHFRALEIGMRLHQRNLGGERALLLYPPGPDFIAAFFGCLYAGVIAVPAYPPNPSRLSRSLQRLAAIVEDSEAAVMLTTEGLRIQSRKYTAVQSLIDRTEQIVTDLTELPCDTRWKPKRISLENIAFLQYTSGSTASPKGVMVSHGNVLSNLLALSLGYATECGGTMVSWLPQFHDMGLVLGLIWPIYSGRRCYVMAPMDFLTRPARWLEAISTYRADLSVAPNFAYDLCVRKVTKPERSGLDLSCWTAALNGAEPVRWKTMVNFSKTFELSGFNMDAFVPCYGLAEAVLFVSGTSRETPPSCLSVGEENSENDRVVASTGSDRRQRKLVPCGHTRADTEVHIVDPHTKSLCPKGQIGEVWITGATVAKGYWKRPKSTKETFQARLHGTKGRPFLRTGDLGFLHENQLVVTGRIKDLIIIRGKNYYPQDIEFTVEESHPVLRKGCCAATGVQFDDEERLLVIQELGSEVPNNDTSLEDVFGTIGRAVFVDHDINAHSIALVKRGTILKTSSGKIQRYACNEAFLKGKLELIAVKIGLKSFGAGSEYLALFPEIFATRSGSFASRIRRATPHERQSMLENYLRSRFAEIFHCEDDDLPADCDLIGLGLDSRTLLEIIGDIEGVLNVRLDPPAFYKNPTIRRLATLIVSFFDENPPEDLDIEAASNEDSRSPLVLTIQKGTLGPALICIPALGGIVFPYYALAYHMGSDHTVYCLRDPAFDEKREPCETVEEMASLYVEAIRTVQPSGPYNLCGWSFGGFVAYEMARQLADMDQEVGLLGMIDCAAMEGVHGIRAKGAKLTVSTFISFGLASLQINIDGILYILASTSRRESSSKDGVTTRSGGWRKAARKVRSLWLDFVHWHYLKRSRMAEIVSENEKILSIEQPTVGKYRALYKANARAFHRYRLQPYVGRLTLFKASEQPRIPIRELNSLGWEEFLTPQQVSIHVIEGNHFSIMKNPDVKQIGELLGRLLTL